jgi:protein SCO1/2
LARTDDATTRKIAALLGIQYRKLADGEFNHSTLLTLLDREGRIVAKSGKLGPADPALVKRVHALMAA